MPAGRRASPSHLERILLKHRLVLLLVPCLLLVGAFALAGCGGGDDSTEASGGDTTGAASPDESEIESVIVAALTSEEPSKCTEILTQNFLDTTSGVAGQAAVEECEEEAPDQSDDPDEIEVTDVSVDGADATAVVSFVGSSLDGQEVEVALVKADGGWMLDELLALASLDKEALAVSFEEAFEESSEVSPEMASCFGDAVREASDAQLEELVLESSDSVAAELAESCE